MKPHKDLLAFIQPYSIEVQEIAIFLRKLITSQIPLANELIWDNYNAVAIAYSKSEELKDAFCHIALYSKHVNLGFNRGAELTNSNVKLEGKGKLIRHLKVRDISTFPREEVLKILYEAVGLSESRNKELLSKQTKGKSIVKAISKKKLRPN